jgi:hypothetical protein
MNHSLSGSVFEPLTRTSLQSFRFLPQNLCRTHPVRAAEITRTSLQSLEVSAFACYFVLFEVHDCVLHIPGAFYGIPFDNRVQDNYPANAYYEHSAKIDSQNFY